MRLMRLFQSSYYYVAYHSALLFLEPRKPLIILRNGAVTFHDVEASMAAMRTLASFVSRADAE